MAKYSLIALDMDGTLLNSNMQVSRANQDAIRRACASGRHVALSTGRCLAELRETLEILPEIRYLVCENGSCIYDYHQKNILHLAPLDAQEVLFILDLVQDQDVVIQFFHEHRAHFNRPDSSWCAPFSVGMFRPVFDKTGVWDVHLVEKFRAKPFQVEKLLLYFRDEASRQKVRAILEKHPLKLSDSSGFMLEIVSEGADKGIGLQKLCDHLGIGIGETIAVGDSMNDIEILQVAGLSAAMGNACDGAKAAADIITDDCDHDGVAKVIQEYLLKD